MVNHNKTCLLPQSHEILGAGASDTRSNYRSKVKSTQVLPELRNAKSYQPLLTLFINNHPWDMYKRPTTAQGKVEINPPAPIVTPIQSLFCKFLDHGITTVTAWKHSLRGSIWQFLISYQLKIYTWQFLPQLPWIFRFNEYVNSDVATVEFTT